jgi:hypothetical protein
VDSFSWNWSGSKDGGNQDYVLQVERDWSSYVWFDAESFRRGVEDARGW